MHRIVAATDLSERGAWAIERASRLASATGARVLVVHVTDPNVPPSVVATLHAEAEKMLAEQLASSLAARALPAQTQVQAGRPVQSIIAAAQSHSAELVVIGRHDRHPLLDLFRGSTGERVLRLGNSPVLVVSAPPRADYRRVLVALDFSMPARLALEFAARSFPSADFHVLHAWEMPFGGLLDDMASKAEEAYRRSVEEQLAEYIAGLPAALPPLRPATRQCSPTVAVRESVAALHADLLVLGTHGRTGVARAFLGSVTEDLLKEPPCDVLAVQGW